MDMRIGYKRTEVGVIPDDWEVKRLHALADRIMVGIASAATHAYRDRGVVMFRNQNIKPGRLDDRDVLYIDEVYEENYRNKRLKAGDLLTARTGYPGTTSIVPPQYQGAQSFTTLITRPRQNLVDSEYLCCYVNSEAGKNYFGRNQIGGGQKNVNAGSLKHLPVALPPTKAEQQAIAKALSDADALIGSLEQLIAKKHGIKQGAMQELLTGERRLPGFAGKWTEKAIGQVADIDNDNLAANTKPNYFFRYISLDDVEKGVLKGTTEVVFKSAPSRARRRIRKGDVLFGTVRPNLQSHCIITHEVEDYICSTGFAVIRCRSGQAVPWFIFANLFGHNMKRQIERLIAGSNYPAVNGRDVRELRLVMPEPEEQQAIASALSDMDVEVAALEEKRAKALKIKQGMLQELLTGRIRLV